MKTTFWLLLLIFSTAVKAKSNLELNFSVETNGPGIKIEGNVNNPKISYDPKAPVQTTLEFDVMDLSTGIEMRDDHLHKKVFDVSKRGQSSILFKVNSLNCPKPEGECSLKGTLKIKSISEILEFKVQSENQGKLFSGKALVSLNTFQLKAPSFMGIRPNDLVEVSFKLREE